jgi:hypothetical protein
MQLPPVQQKHKTILHTHTRKRISSGQHFKGDYKTILKFELRVWMRAAFLKNTNAADAHTRYHCDTLCTKLALLNYDTNGVVLQEAAWHLRRPLGPLHK